MRFRSLSNLVLSFFFFLFFSSFVRFEKGRGSIPVSASADFTRRVEEGRLSFDRWGMGKSGKKEEWEREREEMIYGTLSKVDPDNKGPRDKPAGWDWRERDREKEKKKKNPEPLGICYSSPRVRWIRFNSGNLVGETLHVTNLLLSLLLLL